MSDTKNYQYINNFLNLTKNKNWRRFPVTLLQITPSADDIIFNFKVFGTGAAMAEAAAAPVVLWIRQRVSKKS